MGPVYRGTERDAELLCSSYRSSLALAAEQARTLNVCQKAEESGTDRGKTNVYRTNADHRLMAFGLFSGFGDHVSLYRRGTTPDEAYIDEARQFYSWAGAFCSRLPPRYRGLATTLEKLADGFGVYHEVLGHMAAHHMDLMERLSPGQTWHLEHEATKRRCRRPRRTPWTTCSTPTTVGESSRTRPRANSSLRRVHRAPN